MTFLYNDPAEFKNEINRGFAAAYPQYVSRVENASGFVRAGGPLEGKVSLVIGGGSGHFPSYNGVVGTGFADGAVLVSAGHESTATLGPMFGPITLERA